MMTAQEMGKLSQKKQFSKMTKTEKSQYFKELQAKRKVKKGRFSVLDKTANSSI